MNDFPTNVKEKLNSIISDMAEHHWLFSSNPGHDFMRQDLGKLSFYDTMRMIIGMGKGSTNDVISKAFLDIVIQPGQHPDEREAFHTMLDHFQPDDPEKYIITADRGYESYDLLFHCELKHLNYVFRMKFPSAI